MKGKLYLFWYNALKWEQRRQMKRSQRIVKKLTKSNIALAKANDSVLAFEKSVMELLKVK